ncbi:periplasmic sensor signal transduction histidine kinase (Tn6048) (plasmid) [Cupriavidus metallidurans CH34]|uniref:histidine kinase n=1 Tax=Cupriavidus metallidurans (strain ATCC 43123 / DSM 2839 / NBRC 102507 / CH34) TaxID=266264 RepID=Q1LDD7_CUPMC|nr:periplasmic sensor signal transduction histidine kinase (Tn6048) [Cupriavidus metallidurans CH34]ABF10908.1 periplasmic sensor signal transduction histidine kinase (Tn6048) [Cupriavidus metallidurans CH34]ABF11839.1 periplasmic sensor signal transduction histidine kinase (Tn6048) [Cupriavidus metallidurans CH34]EGD05873.1 periplasmic sensor signal transduction histidine kinase [Burkholderia sp. TJI49]
MNESVQLKLSFTLSLAILVVAVVAGVFSFLSAFDEAHELQDDVLRQVAQLMDRQRLLPAVPTTDIRLKDVDEESRVIVQRLGEVSPSTVGVDAGGVLPLPATLADGLHTLEVGGETFRVLVKTTASGERIAVAQESGFRNEIARDGALRTVMPFLILVPVLLLIVADLVRKMFQPIAALSKEIDQRAEQELHPVEDRHLPVEVRPFVVAINRLLARVSQSMESQRRFVADAAHELRSPLTAMSLQAERLAEAEMSSVARERLTVLRQGIERGRSLLDQLLTLAKAQSATDLPKSPVSVQSIYRRVLEDLMPLAEAKHIDIGVEGALDAEVWASELDMIAVVKNLVDNAIRYTPEGGRVDLSVGVSEGKVVLRIQDSGPGIPLAERDRVFDPFYRTLGSEQIGSGLGLSIVQTIANRIGAEIRLDFSDQEKQTGLNVAVIAPMR